MNQAEEVARLVEAEAAFQERMESEAHATAHSLIQSYLGPDHKVIDMPIFFSALIGALKAARE